MAAGATYTPIATYTVTGSSNASYTFSSIPQTYTDLVLVTSLISGSGEGCYFRINGDSGNNYSTTGMYGTGSAATAANFSNRSFIYPTFFGSNVGYSSILISNIMNYANTTTYKTVLSRSGDPLGTDTLASVSMWRGSTGSATQAITSITIIGASGGNVLGVGTTTTLYGIAAA